MTALERCREALRLTKELREGPGRGHAEADDLLLAIERTLWHAITALDRQPVPEPWSPQV